MMFGLFGSQKKIYPRRLKTLLRDISILDAGEQEEVEKMLKKYQSGGISKSEVREAVRDMKFETSDTINREEAEAVKTKLLTFLED